MQRHGSGFRTGARRGIFPGFAPVCLALAFAVAVAGECPAEDRTPALTTPYFSYSLRSIARGQEIAEFVFREILRPDLLDVVKRSVLDDASQSDSLPGLDLQKSLGVAFVLQTESVFPQPVWITSTEPVETPVQMAVEVVGEDGEVTTQVVTVSNTTSTEDLLDFDRILEQLQPVMFGSVTDYREARRLLDSGLSVTTHLRPAAGRNDLYIAKDESDGETVLAIRTRGQEVYFGPGDSRESLDRLADLPVRPTVIADKNDVQATLQMRHIPATVRRRFSRTLWRTAGPGLQRRDEESDDDFALREATSRSMLELIDVAVTGLNEATLAGNVDEADRCVRVSLDIQAVEQSELARRLSDLQGPPSMFLPLHDPQAALSLSISVRLTPFEREWLSRWIRLLQAVYRMAGSEAETDERELSESMLLILDSLQGTIDTGHIDFFVQWEVLETHEYGVVGGIKLAQTAFARHGLERLGQQLHQMMKKQPGAYTGVTWDTDSSRDVVLHRLIQADDLDLADGTTRPLDLCFGSGRGALWFAGGSFNSLTRLQAALDRQAEPGDAQERPRSAPVLLTVKAAPWQGLPVGDDHQSRIDRSLAREAFTSHDGLRLELRPTKQGVRLEGQAEVGFLRWIGLLVARGYDESQL